VSIVYCVFTSRRNPQNHPKSIYNSNKNNNSYQFFYREFKYINNLRFAAVDGPVLSEMREELLKDDAKFKEKVTNYYELKYEQVLKLCYMLKKLKV